MSESVVHQQHSDDPQQRELLRVCRIGRAQGLKGEVTVQVFTDEPDYRFEPGSLLYTRDSEQEFEVAHSRTFKNRWIIHFEGVDDRDAAEALNGTVLYGKKSGFEYYEQRKGFLQAIEPKVGGIEISYGGYAAGGFMDATLWCKITS